MPEAARVRPAKPPAGAALAPDCDVPPQSILHRARITLGLVSETVTIVNENVTRAPESKDVDGRNKSGHDA